MSSRKAKSRRGHKRILREELVHKTTVSGWIYSHLWLEHSVSEGSPCIVPSTIEEHRRRWLLEHTERRAAAGEGERDPSSSINPPSSPIPLEQPHFPTPPITFFGAKCTISLSPLDIVVVVVDEMNFSPPLYLHSVSFQRVYGVWKNKSCPSMLLTKVGHVPIVLHFLAFLSNTRRH